MGQQEPDFLSRLREGIYIIIKATLRLFDYNSITNDKYFISIYISNRVILVKDFLRYEEKLFVSFLRFLHMMTKGKHCIKMRSYSLLFKGGHNDNRLDISNTVSYNSSIIYILVITFTLIY